MKFQFKILVPNDKAKAIIEAYESIGTTIDFYSDATEEFLWKESPDALPFIAIDTDGISTVFNLPKQWFKKKRPLEVGVWYEREAFDGNPNGYGLIEMDVGTGVSVYNDSDFIYALNAKTEKFMYFKM